MLDALAIAQFCMTVMSSDPQYNQACNKALEATNAQTGTKAGITLLEDKTKAVVESKTGSIPFVIGGIGYMAYKEKKLKYTYRPVGLPLDSIGVDAGLNVSSVSIGWKI